MGALTGVETASNYLLPAAAGLITAGVDTTLRVSAISGDDPNAQQKRDGILRGFWFAVGAEVLGAGLGATMARHAARNADNLPVTGIDDGVNLVYPHPDQVAETERQLARYVDDVGDTIVGPLPTTGPLRARTATDSVYRWENYFMKKGNFIHATLEDGVLKVTVKASGRGTPTPRRSGKRMFQDVFDHFGSDRIKSFDALWVQNSSFRSNYDEFMKNINVGMTPEAAAWNTWTGRQLSGREWKGRPVVTKTEHGYEVRFTP